MAYFVFALKILLFEVDFSVGTKSGPEFTNDVIPTPTSLPIQLITAGIIHVSQGPKYAFVYF